MASNFSPLEPNFITPESAQDDDFIEESWGTPADEEVTLLHYFLDDAGVEQASITRTSLPGSVLQARGGEFRAAVEAFYTGLGYTLLSAQVCRERSHSLYGEVGGRKDLLRVVQGGKK